MARKYAGIMALLGMTFVLLRATKNGGGFENSMTSALLWMAALGLVGMVVGSIAQSTVDRAVLTQMEQDLSNVTT